MTATTPDNDIRTGRYAVPIYLFLIAAGLAGNHFPFSILNAHFIFGSIAAMLALQIFGWGPGVASAAIIAGYTYFSWNHPWAFVTMTTEMVVVGWVFTRRRFNLATVDLLYWLFIGIPLGYFCFNVVSELSAGDALFLITKQSVNGVANTLAARLIFSALEVKFKTGRISLRETLCNLLVLFVLTPTVFLITHDGRTDLAEMDRYIRADLARDSRNVTSGLQNWLAERKNAVVHLAALAAKLLRAEMQARLEQADASDAGFLRICLLDREGIAVAYSPEVDELGRSNIGKSFADRPYLPILRQHLRPMVSEVMPSRFGRTGTMAILLAPVVKNGAYFGAVGGILNFDRIGNLMEITAAGQELQYSLLDKNGSVIFSNRKDQKVMEPFSMGKGSFEPLIGLHKKSMPPVASYQASLGDSEEKISLWIPDLPPGISTIELWGKSRYVAESAVGIPGEWTLFLERPVTPFQKRLYAEYCQKFYLLFVILIAALAVAEWVSRRTVAAVDTLRILTRDLPARLESGKEIAWPDSAVLETQHLIANIREMAGSLRDKFVEIRQMSESLERWVKEKTKALQEREAFLRNILENIPAMIFMKDAEKLCFTDLNRTGENLLGYSRHELLGKSDFDFFPKEEADFFVEKDREVISSGRLVEIPEEKIQTRNRGGRILHTKKIPIFDEQGSPQYILGISEDITEYRKNYDALQKANQKLLLNQTAILNIMEDLKTENQERNQAQLRIEHLNQVLRAIRDVNQLIVRERDREKLVREGCRLLVATRGYSSALIVLVDDQDSPVFWATAGLATDSTELAAMLEEGTLPPCCEHARAQKGVLLINDRNVVCGSCPIAKSCAEGQSLCARLNHNGKVFGYLAVGAEIQLALDEEERSLFSEMAEDFSYALSVMQTEQEREKLQAQLIQVQKMESVGRLAGGVAHDYNNMLSVIIGNAELALGNTPLDDPLHEELKEILDAARRSTDITRQLLAFARKQTIRPEVIHLNETVEGMLRMLRRLIGEDIDLSWQPFSGLWPVSMDPSQLDQVLANLLVNARDAIEGVGRVTIETANITFDAEYCADHVGFVPGDFVLLAVSDDGHGMDRDILDNIFEPFFTTKGIGEGTGLGLATVYGIVKQNDGFINVYSEPGKGTTFKIYLPRHGGEAVVIKVQDQEEIPVSRGETVLIVEDETSILKLARRILGRLGYTVLEASTPGRAVDLAGEHKGEINLLITDVVMPEMNGRDLAGKLQALYPDLRVLFMSGYTANVIAHRGVLDEGVHFMQKPFSNRDLAMKVREALEGTKRT